MRPVPPGPLFLGTALDARDLPRLYEHEIAAVIDLALEERPAQLGREMVYCRFPLLDGGGNSPSLLSMAVDGVARLIRDETPTLVACGVGMSRSPAVVAMAIAKLSGASADETLAELVAGQPHDVSLHLWAELRRACG